jgi:kynurenine formamidase
LADLPDYAQLPPAPAGGRSGWGLFGAGDNLGLVNLMTPERIVAAAGLVRSGRMFPLDVPLGSIAPALSRSRGTPRHAVLHTAGTAGFDDVYDNFYPQAASQWDSLGHVGYAPDQFYNGATEDLELARRLAGVDFAPGDIILLHTGFAAWYLDQPRHVREQLPASLRAPGVAHTEEMAAYLWDTHAAAIACDTFGVEVWPADRGAHPMGFLHHMLIGQFGMALGELWWLKDLADDCAADGVYECFLASAPLNAPGGIGSTANALAIK